MARFDPFDEQLAQAWSVQRAAIVPAEASSEQVRAMRRAFMAGARALYNIVGREASPVEAERTVRSLNAELQRFAKDIDEGRA